MPEKLPVKNRTMQKKNILVFRDWYLPGFQGAGTIKSLRNVVAHLGEEYNFCIVTRLRDHLSAQDYPGIEPGQWTQVGAALVLYLPVDCLDIFNLRRVVRGLDFDLVYLTSAVSLPFALQPLLLRRLGLLKRTPVVISPKGELAEPFVASMRQGKVPVRFILRHSGLFSDCWWQATSPLERAQLTLLRGTAGRIREVPELPDPIKPADLVPPEKNKPRGEIRLAYLSRVTPPKNLLFALRALHHLRGAVSLDIYGPAEDPVYWQRCAAEIETLPPGMIVRVHGAVPMEDTIALLRRAHLFVFPSISESFGYVIFEALLAGCPVVIGQETPWRDLAARGIGRDLPLEDPAVFAAAIQEFIDMGQAEYAAASAAAFAEARAMVDERRGAAELRDLFREALERG